MPMNMQLGQPASSERSDSAEHSSEAAENFRQSVEPARRPDITGWTVEETLRMVGELRAKWLRKLQLAERGEFTSQPVVALPLPVRQKSLSASNTVTNMNSTLIPMESKTISEELIRLQKELVEARVRAEVASERLDKAEHRLEGASTLIGCLRARVLELELEGDRLEWQCDKYEQSWHEAENSVRESEELTASLKEKLHVALARIRELESSWWYKLKMWFLSPENVRAQV